MKKIKYKILLGIATLGVIYTIWTIIRPVEIVAVHQDRNYSFILAKNFPITDQGRMEWWGNNKEILNRKYKIPKPNSNGYYLISVWDFSDGYKKLPTGDLRLSTRSSDLLCFDEMKAVDNCIEKNPLLFIRKYDDRYVFSIGRSSYRQSIEGGKIIKDAED